MALCRIASCCSSAAVISPGCRSHHPVESSTSVNRKVSVPDGRARSTPPALHLSISGEPEDDGPGRQPAFQHGAVVIERDELTCEPFEDREGGAPMSQVRLRLADVRCP